MSDDLPPKPPTPASVKIVLPQMPNATPGGAAPAPQKLRVKGRGGDSGFTPEEEQGIRDIMAGKIPPEHKAAGTFQMEFKNKLALGEVSCRQVDPGFPDFTVIIEHWGQDFDPVSLKGLGFVTQEPRRVLGVSLGRPRMDIRQDVLHAWMVSEETMKSRFPGVEPADYKTTIRALYTNFANVKVTPHEGQYIISNLPWNIDNNAVFTEPRLISEASKIYIPAKDMLFVMSGQRQR